jgi:lipopolysaccharide/colanic/teichoic acid biosynthesis glycosyltransferase
MKKMEKEKRLRFIDIVILSILFILILYFFIIVFFISKYEEKGNHQEECGFENCDMFKFRFYNAMWNSDSSGYNVTEALKKINENYDDSIKEIVEYNEK